VGHGIDDDDEQDREAAVADTVRKYYHHKQMPQAQDVMRTMEHALDAGERLVSKLMLSLMVESDP